MYLTNDLFRFNYDTDVYLTSSLIQELERDSSAQDHRTADIRIMSSQFNTLQRWFFETWTEYNECQNDYREKCKDKLNRQIQISEIQKIAAPIDHQDCRDFCQILA